MRNKKGFTLIELLICVALISVVVVFLFRLINTIRNDEKTVGYIRENQVKRNQIMGEIGTIISENGICSFSTSGSVSHRALITFNLCNGKQMIITVKDNETVTVDGATYSGNSYFTIEYDGKKSKYVMSDPNAWYNPIYTYKSGNYYNYDYYRITFKTEKKGLDPSSIDDVEIFWVETNGDAFTQDESGRQIYVVPRTGIYLLEAWGAQGGGNSSGNGGYGAYASGEVSLDEGQKVMIYVGTQGGTLTAGYNGGGAGGSASGTNGYGGGGATHMTLYSGLLSALSSQQTSLLIAAAGGGGGGTNNNAKGGHGGGIQGVDGKDYNNATTYYGTGATQSVGGTTAGGSTTGLFGQGASYSGGTNGGNGGGGGYYGGGGSSRVTAGAGGGSSYIGNPRLINPVVYCYDCVESAAHSTKTISTTNKSVSPISGYAKLGTGAAKITLISKQYEFDYTGATQTFAVPDSGTYLLEVWGAQGGGTDDTMGGYGGYSRGEVYLNAGDTIYVTVGSQGNGTTGGYNGGGNGKDGSGYRSYGGGGATHIAYRTGILTSLSSDRGNILIVAGGGGGSSSNGLAYGGSGGGISGSDGINTCSGRNEIGTGANQTTPGYSYLNTAKKGSFGKGGNYFNSTGGAGGGGGFFGGGPSGMSCAGAGGGSGYIGSSFLSNASMVCININGQNCETSTAAETKTTAVASTEVSTDPMSNKLKIGNGYARVTYMGRGSAIDYSNHVYYSNGSVYENLSVNHNKSSDRATFTSDSILLSDATYNVVYTDAIDLSRYNTVIVRKDNFNLNSRIGFKTDPSDVDGASNQYYTPEWTELTSDIHVADISDETRSDLKFFIEAANGDNAGRIYYISFSTKTIDDVIQDHRFVE